MPGVKLPPIEQPAGSVPTLPTGSVVVRNADTGATVSVYNDRALTSLLSGIGATTVTQGKVTGYAASGVDVTYTVTLSNSSQPAQTTTAIPLVSSLVETRSVDSSHPQFGAFFGNATASEYNASPTMWQNVWYAALDTPLAGLLPQASLTRLKAFNKFLDDSIQADASQVFSVNLGTPWTAVTPMVADEFDAVVQSGNKHTGYGARVIGAIAAVETQGSGSEIDFAYGWDYAAKSARDAGSIIRQHAAYHSEDQSSGIAGKLGAAWSVLVPLGIHSRNSLGVGQWTGIEGHMNAASIATATAVTLESGHGAGAFRGSGPFVAGQSVQIDVGTNAEIRTIAPAGVSGDTLTFTVALSKAHAQYCRVAVLDANGYGMWYMSSGSLKTDSIVAGQSFNAIQFVQNSASAGFWQSIAQTGGDPSTPNAGTKRDWYSSVKQWMMITEDGIKSPFWLGHRKIVNTTSSVAVPDAGIIARTATATAVTITLPAANAVAAGTQFIFKDEAGDASTSNITVSRAGADDIEGVATKVINTNNGTLRLYSNGSNRWYIF